MKAGISEMAEVQHNIVLFHIVTASGLYNFFSINTCCNYVEFLSKELVQHSLRSCRPSERMRLDPEIDTDTITYKWVDLGVWMMNNWWRGLRKLKGVKYKKISNIYIFNILYIYDYIYIYLIQFCDGWAVRLLANKVIWEKELYVVMRGWERFGLFAGFHLRGVDVVEKRIAVVEPVMKNWGGYFARGLVN